MSYCVNCGVELDPSEKSCPLCGVEVQNPRQPYDDKAVRPYPRRLDPINARINRLFTATILSICLAFPAVLCVAVNLFLNGIASWSLYAAGGLALAWVLIVPYFLMRKPTFGKLFWPDAAGLLLYIWLIASMQPRGDWYLPLAMPIVLAAGFLVFVTGILISRRLVRGFAVPAAILISTGLLATAIDLITKRALLHRIGLNWSFFVLIPCLAVAMVCLAISRRQGIREEIKKRLHL